MKVDDERGKRKEEALLAPGVASSWLLRRFLYQAKAKRVRK